MKMIVRICMIMVMTLNVIILVMISRRIDEDVVTITDHLTAFVSLFVGFSQNIVWVSLLSNDDKRV